MFRTLACLAVLVCTGPVLAANGVRDVKPQAPPLRQGEAAEFAQQLTQTIKLIAEQYIQPVETPAAVYAALAALYEEAGVPVPGTLRGEVNKAKDAELFNLMVRTREALGSAEVLRGTRAYFTALRGLGTVLDPWTRFMPAEDRRRSSGENADVGTGLTVADHQGVGPLWVRAVAPGSPAQVEGIRPGDQITHLDGKPAGAMTFAEALRHLGQEPAGRGETATALPARVTLTLLRPGVKEPRKVTLDITTFDPETVLGVRRRPDNSWDFFLDPEKKIGYIRVTKLSGSVVADLRGALTGLQADGMRGLILDFRWCPPGFINEATETARVFLGEGQITTIKYRPGQPDEPYTSTGANSFADFPLVVLVNGETTGSAEMIAAALQDNKRAVIAGQRSRGKGSVQHSITLPVNNLQLWVTSGLFIRPNGKPMHRFAHSKPEDDWGVRPDPRLEFILSPELTDRLRDWYALQALRPGTSREYLPLDDPAKDPQRQAAYQGLLAMLRESSAKASR
jgi:carboxyl-terminal processing protease